MDESDDNIDFDLVSFLSKSESDDEEEEVRNEIKRNNIVDDLIDKVAIHQVKQKMTYKGTANMVDMMNSMPNAAVKIPLNRQNIKHHANKAFDHRILVFCERCDNLVEEKKECNGCGRIMIKNTITCNYLVHIPIEPQIRRILMKHFDVVMAYIDRQRTEDAMTDIDDGHLFEKIRTKYRNNKILTFTLNIDGANIFKCSKNSIWPVQLYFNALPPNIRFLFDNIIVTTLYYGTKKPNVETLLYPIAKELDYLHEQLISIYIEKENCFHNFIPVLLLCACDLPARADLQNMKNTAGFYSCPYCYQKGLSIKNASSGSTVRYVKTANVQLRTHEETISNALDAEKNKSAVYGVKGQSAMLLFDDIDVINSCVTDYMHGIPLGIFKDLMCIWLGIKTVSNKSTEYKIKSVENRKVFNRRILKLKPFSTFNRKPRSVFEVANFKASELLFMMWYYVRYALVGLIPTRVIKHFEKLSAAIYILCKKSIQKNEIHMACYMLISFADEFELIYGQNAVTKNLHLLRHYHNMILNCGPLWCYSLFGFENNIGKLKGYVQGKTRVLEQVLNKYVIEKGDRSEEHTQCINNDSIQLYQPTVIKIESKYAQVLVDSGVVSCESSSFEIWRRIRMHNLIYTSTKAVETKSIDYFVKLKSQKMGKIVFYFKINAVCHILLSEYIETFQNFHWVEVNEAKLYSIHACTAIEEKLMYFTAGSIEYVTREPNTFGKCCL